MYRELLHHRHAAGIAAYTLAALVQLGESEGVEVGFVCCIGRVDMFISSGWLIGACLTSGCVIKHDKAVVTNLQPVQCSALMARAGGVP